MLFKKGFPQFSCNFSKSCLNVARKKVKSCFLWRKLLKKLFVTLCLYLILSKNMQIVKQNKEFLGIFVQFWGVAK